MMNLLEGAALFIGMVASYEKGVHDALDDAAKIIQVEAKQVIGTYDYGWPELAESTQENRVSLGYSPNDPLLREGDLRASIERTVIGSEQKAYVGSNEDKAVWQELGTSNGIPPRSFLEGAARHKGEEAAYALGQAIFFSLTAHPVTTSADLGYSHWSGQVNLTKPTLSLP